MSLEWHTMLGMRCQHRPTPYTRESVDLKLQRLVIPKSFACVLQRTKSIHCTGAWQKPWQRPHTGTCYQPAFYAWQQQDSTAKKNARHCYIYFLSGAMLRGTLGIYLFLGAWCCHLRQCESSPHNPSANSKDWLQSLHSSSLPGALCHPPHEPLLFPACIKLQPHHRPSRNSTCLLSKHEVLALSCIRFIILSYQS